MIPINSRQGLPANAFWYVALRSLAAAIFLILVGRLFQVASNSPNVSCRGLLCDSVSGGQMSVLIYLFAAFLVANAILRYKWFSFVLTDKNISIDSGVLFRRSRTIRFDRIQDVNTIRNPLHAMLGLASVAIWTASLDQRVGNANRPDGLIVLDADTADWLQEYLSNPPAGQGDPSVRGNSQPVAGDRTARRGSAGIVLVLAFVAAVAMGLLVFRKERPATVPAAPSATTLAEPAVTRPNAVGVKNHVRVMQPARSQAVAAAVQSYATSCAIHQPGGMDGVRLCADLKEGGRCEHEADFQSHPTQEPAVLTVVNRSSEIVRFYWLDLSGARSLYASLPPGGHVDQQSHIGAYWLLSAADGHCIGILSAATKAVGIF